MKTGSTTTPLCAAARWCGTVIVILTVPVWAPAIFLWEWLADGASRIKAMHDDLWGL